MTERSREIPPERQVQANQIREALEKPRGNLIITRKEGQTLHLSPGITIEVLQAEGGRTVLSVKARDEILILRGELLEKDPQDNPPTSQ